jgi:hypothetical protein
MQSRTIGFRELYSNLTGATDTQFFNDIDEQFFDDVGYNATTAGNDTTRTIWSLNLPQLATRSAFKAILFMCRFIWVKLKHPDRLINMTSRVTVQKMAPAELETFLDERNSCDNKQERTRGQGAAVAPVGLVVGNREGDPDGDREGDAEGLPDGLVDGFQAVYILSAAQFERTLALLLFVFLLRAFSAPN